MQGPSAAPPRSWQSGLCKRNDCEVVVLVVSCCLVSRDASLFWWRCRRGKPNQDERASAHAKEQSHSVATQAVVVLLTIVVYHRLDKRYNAPIRDSKGMVRLGYGVTRIENEIGRRSWVPDTPRGDFVGRTFPRSLV